ncbi:hypothetical protein [Ewingella americana]|uniref:hypothetical protein n=1 Tax=Ewingella americana TaxID=41202 RepID=UPI0012AD447B|nr:hypothetical protein [Ewingella americana]MRT05906.1 hypothetical protein [Ewingella americana]
MQINSVSNNYINSGEDMNVAPGSSPSAFTSPANALMDIQSMLDKVSLLFKSLRDQTQDRQVSQRSNSFKMIEAKLEQKKKANDAEAKAGFLSAGLGLGGAVVGGGFGVKGVKNSAQGITGKSTLTSQLFPKLTEASGGIAETQIRQSEVNPARLQAETISGHQEIYDKDRERTENKADEFARQVLKTQEAINNIFREFNQAAQMK